MKTLFHPKKLRVVIFAFGLATTGVACGRHLLHTGATAAPVAPPLPTQTHSDGTCDPGFDPCQDQAPGFCFDLQASPNHCGACGNACPLRTPCEGGQCLVVHCTQQVSVQTMRVDNGSGSNYQIALADFDRDGSLDMVAPLSNRLALTSGLEMGRTAGVFRVRRLPPRRVGDWSRTVRTSHGLCPEPCQQCLGGGPTCR